MSSSQMKLRRKMCKYQNIIMNDYGITLSQFPTEILLICNGGLVNGVSQEIVFETFCTFGQIVNVVMIPGKSYCFIIFRDMIYAQEAFKSLNNKYIWPIINGPIYLAFADKPPPESLNIKINFSDKPPGLFIFENFITEEDENRILKFLESCLTKNKGSKFSDLKNRRVYHFGYEFKYSNNKVNMDEPIEDIPEELAFIWDKLQNISLESGLKINFRPDQLTVNNYQPGQGIPPHVDTHSAFEDPIVSLSLQSLVVMDFKNFEKRYCPVILPARSICVMSGASRYGWTHGIAARKSDIVPGSNDNLTLIPRKERTSFTFRKIKNGNCSCQFPYFCDSQFDLFTQESRLNTLKEDVARKLEENYVHEVYEKISGHFSITRHKPWPNIVEFIQSLPKGSILVDVGCGNGKYFTINSGNFEIGLDASLNLAKVCRQRGFECFTSNCLRIPLRSNVADGCISIAVIHHLTTQERRMKAIHEIIRILRPGGRALIYVWAKNQERLNKKSCYLRQNLPKLREQFEEKTVVLNDISSELTLPVHTNRTNFAYKDLLVPWKLNKNLKKKECTTEECPVYLRFYHVFEDEELKDLCSGLNNTEIIDYYYDQGNWCIMLKKHDLCYTTVN